MSRPLSRRLLDCVHEAIRVRHYSRRTGKAYASWVRRFVLFHGKRHPETMGEAEVTAFLTHLATVRKVSPSTQNQALSALLFLYREVLGQELPWLGEIVRAKRPVRVPEAELEFEPADPPAAQTVWPEIDQTGGRDSWD